MTERLAFYQQKTAEYAEAETPIKAFLGTAYAGIEKAGFQYFYSYYSKSVA